MNAQPSILRDVETTLNYYQPEAGSEPPYYYVGPPREGIPSNNVTTKPYPAVIRDARGRQDALGLGLNSSGFQWVTYPSAEKEFVDEQRIKLIYYAEVEDILKKHAGAKVFIFDHTIRRSEPSQAPSANETRRGPVQTVQVDQTPAAAETRVRQNFPDDDAKRLLKGRYQIIDVWRPIANSVAHHPLGVTDFRSVDVHSDLVSTRLILPTRVGETYTVKYSPGHQWYYLSNQNTDEVTLIKCFDSDTHADDGNSKAVFTPHSVFADLTSPADAPHRQSIEVRALVFDRE